MLTGCTHSSYSENIWVSSNLKNLTRWRRSLQNSPLITPSLFARSLLSSCPMEDIRRAIADLVPPPPQMPLSQWAPRYLLSKTATDLQPLTPQSLLHQWLCQELDAFDALRGQKVNVLAPRGSGKTSWSTFAYPLKRAVEGAERFIVLTSDTSGQADAYLSDIRQELESNAELAAAYPFACGRGRVWRDNKLVLRNGVTIQSFGTGQKIRGRKADRIYRPSLIIIDDPQNTDHVSSQLQRERSWEWFTKDISVAGDPQTNMIVLGTAIHRESIVCKLQETAGWRSRKFESIIQWPARMDLWAEWEAILHNHENTNREADAKVFYEECLALMNE